MYVLEAGLKAVQLQGTILTLIQSINRPMVAAADLPAEETQAFIVSVQSPTDRSISAFIYLHLLQSNQCVIYRYSDAPFMGDRLEEAETEALDFVESMGFMMDNLRFNKLQSSEQEVLSKEIPIFYADLADFAPVLERQRAQAAELEKFETCEEEEEPLLEDEPLRPSQYHTQGEGEGGVFTDLEEVVEVNEVTGPLDLSQKAPNLHETQIESAQAEEDFFDPEDAKIASFDVDSYDQNPETFEETELEEIDIEIEEPSSLEEDVSLGEMDHSVGSTDDDTLAPFFAPAQIAASMKAQSQESPPMNNVEPETDETIEDLFADIVQDLESEGEDQPPWVSKGKGQAVLDDLEGLEEIEASLAQGPTKEDVKAPAPPPEKPQPKFKEKPPAPALVPSPRPGPATAQSVPMDGGSNFQVTPEEWREMVRLLLVL
jgi:hypothetical protein